MKNYFELWFNGTLEGKYLLKHDVQCRIRTIRQRNHDTWIAVHEVKNGVRQPLMYDSLNEAHDYHEMMEVS